MIVARLSFALSFLFLMAVSPALQNQAKAADPQIIDTALVAGPVEPGKVWEVVVSIPSWLPWTDGTMRTGPVTSDVYLTGWKALENLRMMFVGQFEVIYNEQFTGLVENFYADIGETDQFRPGGGATVEFRESITDARLGYRIINNHYGWLEAYAGIRWWDVHSDLSVTTPGVILMPITVRGSSGGSWVDPIVGLRAQYNLTDHWYVTALGDIGGFDVGSDFAWRIQAGGGYRFNEHWAADLQYKAFSVDYDNEQAGLARFVYDVFQQGPLFRLRYTF